MKTTQPKAEFKVETPTDREIVMTRVLDAPRATVFRAFTEPALIKRWLLGPDGWSMPVCDVDLTPGGLVRYVWRNDEDGREFGIAGVCHEVVAPERITRTEKMDGQPGEALVTTTFIERDGSTTVTMTILYETREIRDIALASGMEHGVAASYDRLSGVLASMA